MNSLISRDVHSLRGYFGGRSVDVCRKVLCSKVVLLPCRVLAALWGAWRVRGGYTDRAQWMLEITPDAKRTWTPPAVWAGGAPPPGMHSCCMPCGALAPPPQYAKYAPAAAAGGAGGRAEAAGPRPAPPLCASYSFGLGHPFQSSSGSCALAGRFIAFWPNHAPSLELDVGGSTSARVIIENFNFFACFCNFFAILQLSAICLRFPQFFRNFPHFISFLHFSAGT